MPRIPIYQQQNVPNGASLPANLSPSNTGAALANVGQGLRQVAGAQDNVAEMQHRLDMQRLESEAKINAATLGGHFEAQMKEHLLAKQETAGDGANGLHKDFLKDYDEHALNTLSAAPNDRVRELLRARMAQTRESLGGSAMVYEATERARNSGKKIQDAIDVAQKLVRNDPAEFDRQMAILGDTIDSTPINPEARAKLSDIKRGSLAWSSVTSTIESDPEKFLLGEGRGNAWNALTADEQGKAMDYADRAAKSAAALRVSQEEQARKAADRYEKEVNEFFSKEGDKLLTAGKLTPKWVEDNRNNISPSDYRYFHRALRGGDESAQTNRVLYSDLRERAGRGEDVRADARLALTQGSVKLSDYEKIINAVESNNAVGTSWYKRGNSYIRDTLKPSDMNYDPAAAQRMASAMDDWTEWAAKNPKASDDEAQQAYTRLTREYGMIDFQQMIVTKRQPTYLVGGRGAPNLDATEDATVDALHSGAITQEEFARQSELIEQWRSALEAQAKLKPAGAK